MNLKIVASKVVVLGKVERDLGMKTFQFWYGFNLTLENGGHLSKWSLSVAYNGSSVQVIVAKSMSIIYMCEVNYLVWCVVM